LEKEEVFLKVREAAVRSNRDLTPASVHHGASLVLDLGMDSLHLVSFIGELKSQFGDIDMTGWYVLTARAGGDTVSGLVDFLCQALPKVSGRVNP
jgi:acyl carrier protein